MERRLFLKNMLGAAVVAALPIPVMENLIEFETLSKSKIPNNSSFSKEGHIMWFLQEGKVIGRADDIVLNVKHNKIDVTQHRDSYPQYLSGPPSWNVSNCILPKKLYSKFEKIFNSDLPIQSIICYKDMRFYGIVMLITMTYQGFDQFYVDCEGTGVLILDHAD